MNLLLRSRPSWTAAVSRRLLTRIVAALALLLVVAGVLWLTAHVARESSLRQLLRRDNHALQLYVANIRRELSQYEYLPRLLADDHRVREMLADPAAQQSRYVVDRYLEFVAQASGAAAIYVLTRQGLTLASSNWNRADSFVGHNYGFRPYFQQAMQGRLGRYYALGTASARRGYYFAQPVVARGRIVGVVTVKVPLSSLEDQRAGAQYEFLVTDPHGIIFLSTRPEWRYHALAPLTRETRRQIAASRRYAGHPIAPLPVLDRAPFNDEASLLTLDEQGGRITYLKHGVRMPEAGWQVYILSNTTPVDGYVIHSMLLAAFILGALVLSALFVRQRRARLAERVHYEHAAMHAAAANEARVRAIIDSTRAGLITLDEQGRIELFNPTAEALFERPAGEVVNARFDQLLAPRSAEEFRTQLSKAARAGVRLPVIELLGRRRGEKTFPLEATVNRMRMPEGVRLIVTLHDISERKRQEVALQRAHDQLEQRVSERTSDLLDTNRRLIREIEERQRTETELRRTRDELVQAAKLAAIGQLSAGINHELNQPLTAIRFFADNARAFLERSRLNDVRDNLVQIDALTERMGKIVHQLKLFARKSSGQPVPVSITAVVDGALALLVPRLKREHVVVHKSLPSDDVYCLGDLVRLEQVVVNLVGNAIQAMQGQTSPCVDIVVDHAGGRARLSVRDHGPGIRDDDLPQIFDPFFTTKKSGEGLGLGLSISMRIIEELSGTMRAFNHADGGAVFTIELPGVRARESVNE